MEKKLTTLTPNDVSSKAYEVFTDRGLYLFVDDEGYYYLADNKDGARPGSFACIEDVSDFLEEVSHRDDLIVESQPIELEYVNGFASKQFISHLVRKHTLNREVFTVLMLEKIINYGLKNYSKNPTVIAYYLMEVIPELDESEAFAYFDDNSLSDYGRKIKRAYWKAHEIIT